MKEPSLASVVCIVGREAVLIRTTRAAGLPFDGPGDPLFSAICASCLPSKAVSHLCTEFQLFCTACLSDTPCELSSPRIACASALSLIGARSSSSELSPTVCFAAGIRVLPEAMPGDCLIVLACVVLRVEIRAKVRRRSPAPVPSEIGVGEMTSAISATRSRICCRYREMRCKALLSTMGLSMDKTTSVPELVSQVDRLAFVDF